MALDEPTDEDVVQNINGIVVAIDRTVIPYTENISLDVQNDTLVMLGNESCC